MRTISGRDHIARLLGDPASDGTGDYAPATWIGLSDSTVPPSETNEILTGEITSGTLKRARASYAHTSGTNLYTLTRTFVSDQTVTITKIGVFTEETDGIMLFEVEIDPVLLRSGDQVQITEAVTLG